MPLTHDSDHPTTTRYPHILGLSTEDIEKLVKFVSVIFREPTPVNDESLGNLWFSLNGVLGNKGILLDSNQNTFLERASKDAKLRKDCKKAIQSHVLDDLLRNSSIIRIERAKYVNPLLQSAVEKDWERPYVGDYANTLVDSINETLCSPANQGGYSNLGSIIQSSGYGKSRMVDEVSKKYFTLPFNVRPEKERGSLAYPPPDDSVRDYFTVPMVDSGNVRLRDSLFFRHLFLLTRETLDADFVDVQALPHAWRDWLKQSTHPGWGENRQRMNGQPRGVNRSVLYEEAIKRACFPTLIAYQYLKTHALNDLAGTTLVHAVQELEKAVIGLLKQLGAMTTTGLTLFLYFDEVHSLFYAHSDTVDQTRWDILCSTLASITNARDRNPGIASADKVAARTQVFCVSLSTASHFPSVIRPKHMASSARAANPDVKLFPPYTTTPFDINMYDPGTVTIADLVKISYLAKFGRPLWSVLQATPQQLMDLAIGKLSAKPVVSYKAPIHTLGPSLTEPPRYTNSSAITDNEDNFVLDSLAAFAAMSTRVLIDVEPQRETARRLISTLVCNHLRTVFLAPAHREYMSTGTPSEPILAEAAAVIMHESRLSMAKFLGTMLASNLIGKGERGELVARALLIMAIDRAIHIERLKPSAKALQTLYDNDLPVYHRTVSVKSFIEALVSGSSNQDVLLKSRPQNISDKNPATFDEAFEHGYVCFTHFVRSEDATNTTAFLAFTRGAALQFDHPTWDIGIPVAIFDVKYINEYRGVENILLSRARWTMLLFSIKAGGTAQPASYTMNPDRAGFWTALPPHAGEGRQGKKRKHAENDNENVERNLYDSVPVAVFLMELDISGDRARSKVEANTAPSRTMARETGKASQTTTSTHKPKVAASQAMTKTRVLASQTTTRKIKAEDTASPATTREIKQHPRYAFAIIGCSSGVYSVIDSSENNSYHALLSAGTLLDEHPRSHQKGIVKALRAAKPTLSSDVDCWSCVVPEWLEAYNIKMEEDLVDVENGWVEAWGFGDEDDSQAETDIEMDDATKL